MMTTWSFGGLGRSVAGSVSSFRIDEGSGHLGAGSVSSLSLHCKNILIKGI
jgi:hypothetical protein